MASRLEWLDSKHPVWVKWNKVWKRNEMLLRAGATVIERELRRFPWEVPVAVNDNVIDDTPFQSRVKNAVFINFGDMYLTTMAGHLLRQAPTFDENLSFGTLGQVKRAKGQKDPSVAELIAFNVDGIGNDGSQWDNYWMAAWKRAGATGHRWMYVEAPLTPSQTVGDQLRGNRPWMVEYSPVMVTNWHISKGVLQWAVVRVRSRNPIVNANGTLAGNEGGKGYFLVVRQGVQELGKDFQNGGWWLFDKDKNRLPLTGDWMMTDGEIPMFPLFYERDEGRDSDDDFDQEPSMSRPGITELNNASVSYMNLSSAADYDVWDSGAGVTFFLNVDSDGWDLATAKAAAGSKWIPVRGMQGIGSGVGTSPQVIDSQAGAVTAENFEKRLERKLKEVRTVAMNEATLSPDASGLSKQMGFVEGKSPRLTMYASEMEQAQNTAIMFLEQRAGNRNPSGVCIWPRNFDLLDTVASVREVFDVEKVAGISSPTMRKKAMRKVIVARGLAASDDELNMIEDEYAQSADLQNQAKTQGLINAAKETPDQNNSPSSDTRTPIDGNVRL